MFVLGASVHVLTWSTAAEAACRQPAMAVQVEQRKVLEGEVQAGVAMLKGAASGASEAQASWQANLPSQSIVDNQWRLYLLCENFEAGMLTRDAYCAASAGIWEQIVGRPIPVEGCEKGGPEPTPKPVAPVAAAEGEAVMGDGAAADAAMVDVVAAPAPTSTRPTVDGARSVHWVLPSQVSSRLEMWGPFSGPKDSTAWVVFNGSCLSYIVGDDTGYREVMLLGRISCAPWSSVTVSVSAERLSLVADGKQYEFEVGAGSLVGDPTGAWEAEFYGKLPPKVRPVRLEFVGEHVAAVWKNTGCTANWVRRSKEENTYTFTENVDQVLLCADGAQVDVEVMSSDTLLLSWHLAGTTVWGIARQ
jgi:hypothetical protein